MRLEELPDLAPLPTHNFLKDGHEHGERVVADHSLFCDVGTRFLSEAAMVKPSRTFTCSIAWIFELPSPT
jgi:hypothetical protein